MNLKKLGRLVTLFRIQFCISAFTFGGGYVVIPMMRKHFVDGQKVLNEEELLDIAAVAQSTPGAIAVNMASLVGYRTAGIPGAVISCIGAVLPALLLLSVISHYYAAFRSSAAIAAILHGMEAGVAALIVDLVAGMFQTISRKKNRLLTALVPAAFIAHFFLHINVLVILLASAAACLLPPALKNLRARRQEELHE